MSESKTEKFVYVRPLIFSLFPAEQQRKRELLVWILYLLFFLYVIQFLIHNVNEDIILLFPSFSLSLFSNSISLFSLPMQTEEKRISIIFVHLIYRGKMFDWEETDLLHKLWQTKICVWMSNSETKMMFQVVVSCISECSSFSLLTSIPPEKKQNHCFFSVSNRCFTQSSPTNSNQNNQSNFQSFFHRNSNLPHPLARRSSCHLV